jgi:rRNA maturation endonuclease Nob1
MKDPNVQELINDINQRLEDLLYYHRCPKCENYFKNKGKFTHTCPYCGEEVTVLITFDFSTN